MFCSSAILDTPGRVATFRGASEAATFRFLARWCWGNPGHLVFSGDRNFISIATPDTALRKRWITEASRVESIKPRSSHQLQTP